MFKVLVNWLYIALTTACLGTGIAALAENKLHYRFKMQTVYWQWGLFWQLYMHRYGVCFIRLEF